MATSRDTPVLFHSTRMPSPPRRNGRKLTADEASRPTSALAARATTGVAPMSSSDTVRSA